MKKKSIKKLLILLIMIILFIGTIIGTTYALFYNESVSSNPSNYQTGILDIKAISKTNNILLPNALPLRDEEGVLSDPYVFSITNTGNLNYKFNVKLLSTSENTFSPRYIKIKVDDEEVTTLSSLTNSIIKKDVVLSKGDNLDISIRIWLDINTPNTEIGKEFKSQIVTDGEAIYTTTEVKENDIT